MNVLLVIDMQAIFEASLEPGVQNNCIREIKRAMKRGEAVVFVEYDCWDFAGDKSGATIRALKNTARGYGKSFTIKKNDDDGSPEVVRLFALKRIEPKVIRVCGVNTTACVLDTVSGLHYKGYRNIRIVYDACNDEYETRPEKLVARCKYFKDIKVINMPRA